MTGILDGHNLEVGSTPIDRLEEDIATQSELEDVIDAIDAEALIRANADTLLQTNINNLEAAVNNNYVHKTGNMAEVVTGVKTFANDLVAGADVIVQGDLTVNGTTTTLDSQNLAVADNIIFLNNGETGSAVTAGIAGFAIDRGTGTNYRVIFDEGLVCLRAGFEGSEECLATKNYVDNQIGTASGGLVALGTANFAGSGNGVYIGFSPSLGARPYTVSVIPSADTNEEVGSIWVERQPNADSFIIYNSGHAQTAFDWSVGVVGVLPAATGLAGGDLSGTYPDPNVISLRGRSISTTAPLSGQALIWNGTAWAPSNSAGSPGGSAGGDLGSTYPNPSVVKMRGRTISNATPADGNVLTYISSTASWTPQAPTSGGGATDLNGLSDVTITSPNSLSFLHYDGSIWGDSQIYLNWLADVTLGSQNNGDVLTWNGTSNKWESTAPGGTGGTIIASGTGYTAPYGNNVFISGVVSTDVVVVTHRGQGPNPYAVAGLPSNGYITLSTSYNASHAVDYVVVRP